MAKLETFGIGMIKAALDAQSWNYTTDDDGALDVLMRYDEEPTREGVVTFNFSVEGKNSTIFHFQTFTHKSVEKPNWGRALLTCNKWNHGFRWPKAYLLTPDDGATTGYLCLEWHVDFEEGIHQEFLNTLVDQLTGAAVQFSRWAFEEHGFRCSIKT